MFRPRTLFVVGAGASKEVNFPTGSELIEKIAQLWDIEIDFGRLQRGDSRFVSCLERSLPNNKSLSSYLNAARQFSEGLKLANSIDSFIYTHKHDPNISLCGKTAIAYAILNAEKDSSLFIKQMNIHEKINYDKVKTTWYAKFANIIFDQISLDEIDNLFSNISIICFNYDRCIQYYLISAISTYFLISPERAQKIVEGLKIFHPYGYLGNLPAAGSANGIGFGQITNSINVVDLSKSIKTYTEEIEESGLLKSLRQEVTEAETIVFLGFGFHPQNMNILAPKRTTNVRKVYATAIGFSDADSAVIKDQIHSALHTSDSSLYPSLIDVQVRNDLSCNQLFADYQRTLSTY